MISSDWIGNLPSTYADISEFSPKNKKASVSIVDLNYSLGNKPAAETGDRSFRGSYDISTEIRNIHGLPDQPKRGNPGEDFIIRQLVELYKAPWTADLAISELDSLGDMLLEAGKKSEAVAVIQEIVISESPQCRSLRETSGTA